MRHHLTVYHTLIKDGFKLYNFYRLDGTPCWKLSETCQASGFTIVLNRGIHQTPTQTHSCGWVLNGSVGASAATWRSVRTLYSAQSSRYHSSAAASGIIPSRSSRFFCWKWLETTNVFHPIVPWYLYKQALELSQKIASDKHCSTQITS